VNPWWRPGCWAGPSLTTERLALRLPPRLSVCPIAAREVHHNHNRMVANGHLSESPFWQFVMANAPTGLYRGYRTTLYGLVRFRMCVCVGGGGDAMVALIMTRPPGMSTRPRCSSLPINHTCQPALPCRATRLSARWPRWMRCA
jgi:hypothetical protein